MAAPASASTEKTAAARVATAPADRTAFALRPCYARRFPRKVIPPPMASASAGGTRAGDTHRVSPPARVRPKTCSGCGGTLRCSRCGEDLHDETAGMSFLDETTGTLTCVTCDRMVSREGALCWCRVCSECDEPVEDCVCFEPR